ncbi:MAG: DUF3857 domain-containing protein [Erythrobacter sp.]|uniref:DUF3857 domain-containing protein n=1 Tax=Erythrobacter sp. TaxID=1042 RepID=UPI0026393783|nr:DUF3857 domain-containing protein [Erythrobacter sp.]MDJ0979096.1 DUF3857 domain-containing protein [Erythrobacter sp.]
MVTYLVSGASALALPIPALAGDEVIYQPAPEWVEEADLVQKGRTSNSPLVLLDQQSRIEDGELWTYVSTAAALDTPQALTQFGTLTAEWLPDKGDLIVHSAEIIREGEVINLLADGAQFEVLRREQGLEARLIDGSLTATLNVPGARVGDIIHLAYSVSLDDQALEENVQWQSPLPAKPFPLEDGRVSVSWPVDLEVSRVRLGDGSVAEPTLEDGYYTWSASLPVDEPDEVPVDAPLRYKIGDLMQVTTYQNWEDVSRQMAQHYQVNDSVGQDDDLAEAIKEIAKQTADPLTRAALAVQKVQDDVSYLLNGLNGGNYLPQAPEETWEKRFGDCKAKSLLLLAMLRKLDIEAEVALVRTRGGDALPGLAPMPGNFDHMIVRAEIGGTSYWLDGTTSGTRRQNIDVVPRFYFALPLREAGSELIRLDERPPQTPNRSLKLTIDHSAGISVPALLDVEIEYTGAGGAAWRAMANQADEDVRNSAIRRAVSGLLGEAHLLDEALRYDQETGVATISARALQTTQWTQDRAVFEFEPPAQAAKDVSFDADRARAAWRDIPLLLNGPVHYSSRLEIILPNEPSGFEIEGQSKVSEIIGGVELNSNAELEDDRFILSQRMRGLDEELPANELSSARRNLTRFSRSLPVLRSPTEVRSRWEYFGDERALLAPLEAFYAQSIEEAEPDDPTALLNRARFLSGIFDYTAALADVEAAHDIEASQEIYHFRAALKRQVGDLQGALDDYRLAEDLKPDGSTHYDQVELLSLLGRHDEAVSIAEEYGDYVDDRVSEAELMAHALAWGGSLDEGLQILEDLKLRRPGDGSLLNAICWLSGIWNKVDIERLGTCTEAVEKSDYSLAALDSRAMANFRLGNLHEAQSDLDAVLLEDPSMADSRLLRGVVRAAQGDPGAREDVDLALAMKPSLREVYEAWGLRF